VFLLVSTCFRHIASFRCKNPAPVGQSELGQASIGFFLEFSPSLGTDAIRQCVPQ
jgi:hypothetical protein